MQWLVGDDRPSARKMGAPGTSAAARWALLMAPEDLHSGGWSDARRNFPPPLSLRQDGMMTPFFVAPWCLRPLFPILDKSRSARL